MGMWEVDKQSQLKGMVCGTCAAFDTTDYMKSCIEKGLGETPSDEYDTVEAGELGYCHMLKFKDGEIWVAFYTLRESAIRIISVRRARENEEKTYYDS